MTESYSMTLSTKPLLLFRTWKLNVAQNHYQI